IRRIIRHNGFFLAIEDLIFWMIAGLFIFSMIYRENNGVIRGFSVMGMAIGMVLYHYILSDFLVSFITKIIRALLRPFRFIIKKIKQL
ncbi:MAG TPA: spore cortex biosynthesis protein YabQ, partial [Lachnospiraceae bacterium]|nr:spore cortex biosynthesis protein YabQ [Lachnospiraceae bacterium]